MTAQGVYVSLQPRTHSGPVKVFISSAMKGQQDLRNTLYNVLKGFEYDPFVYEKNAGANPNNVIKASLGEVEEADFLVAIFIDRLGEVTKEEYLYARKIGIPCLVFIQDHTEQDPELKTFLTEEIFPLNDGVGYFYFDYSYNLANIIHSSIQKYIRKMYREGISKEEELKRLRLQLEKILKETSPNKEQLMIYDD